MDNLQDKIEIPEIVYQGDDKKLKERIFKFKAGSFRITVFTIVGVIMGYFSRTYVTDTFLPTKLIMAIPYKISEAIYTSILGTDAATTQYWSWPPFPNDFFPRSLPATYVAEVVTVILIAGAVYGSLAYFTGDKRVFTLERYLKFAACWCAVILVSIGAAYGINAKAVSDNEKMLGIERLHLVCVQYENGVTGSASFGGEQEKRLLELLYEGLEPAKIHRDYESEIPVNLVLSGGRQTECRINYRDCYLITEFGTTYRISPEFAEVLRTYCEGGSLFEDMQTLPFETVTEEGSEMK